MDELFEVMTLKQTGKVAKDLPIVLFGKEFWSTVHINPLNYTIILHD